MNTNFQSLAAAFLASADPTAEEQDDVLHAAIAAWCEGTMDPVGYVCSKTDYGSRRSIRFDSNRQYTRFPRGEGRDPVEAARDFVANVLADIEAGEAVNAACDAKHAADDAARAMRDAAE